MGELVRRIPLSEVVATLEVLDRLGVTRRDLGKLRRDEDLANMVAHLLAGDDLTTLVARVLTLTPRVTTPKETDWFTFTTTSQSLVEMLSEHPDIFYTPDTEEWESGEFAKDSGKAGRKISLRTGAVPGSFGKTWEEQQELLQEGEFVPSARDLVDGMIKYYRETGRKLFTEFWVRTADIPTNGSHFGVVW